MAKTGILHWASEDKGMGEVESLGEVWGVVLVITLLGSQG